jgi:hypothetical protein
MQVILFIIILLFILWALSMLLDPRRHARLFMRKHSDEQSSWDNVDKHDPESRQKILDLMIEKEMSGDRDWYRMYKSVLEREGITELEVRRIIELKTRPHSKDN